jgi:hypothetical protein
MTTKELSEMEACYAKDGEAAKLFQEIHALISDNAKLQAELDKLRRGINHESCHDSVCNSGRTEPRGQTGHGCSCQYRDFQFIENQKLQAELQKAREAIIKKNTVIDALIIMPYLNLNNDYVKQRLREALAVGN